MLRRKYQSGVMLLEALIGILIFSMGILAMIAMQAAAVTASADAQYRSEAAYLANQIISEMWVNVDRSTSASLQTSLNNFQYNTGGTNCAYSGGAVDATNTLLAGWVSAVTSNTATRLPGATTAMQQVTVNTGANNLVTVSVCWQAPNDQSPRRHVLTANIF